MPRRFPEYPGVVFLTFREVWDGLPVDGQKYVWWYGFRELQPYALWTISPTPYVPRPVPSEWLRFPHWWLRPTEESDLVEPLYTLSELNAHDGPDGVLHIYFDSETVEAFKKAGPWTQVPGLDVELPQIMQTERAKGGRPCVGWHELVADTKDIDEAVARLPALPEGMKRFFKDESGHAGVRFGPGENDHVSRKHFQRVRRGGLNPKRE